VCIYGKKYITDILRVLTTLIYLTVPGPVAGSCEHGSEILRFMEGDEDFDRLLDSVF
jgi:hypothetical protein